MRRSVFGSLLSVLVLFGFAAVDPVWLEPVFNAGAEEDSASATRGAALEQAPSPRKIRKPSRHFTRISPAKTRAASSTEPSRFIRAQLPLIDPHDSLRALRI